MAGVNKIFLISVDGMAAAIIRQTALKQRQPRQYIADEWARDHGVKRAGVNIIDVTAVPMHELRVALNGSTL